MAADIVNILNQQARGESGVGRSEQRPNFPQDRPLNDYRPSGGGPRERLHGGVGGGPSQVRPESRNNYYLVSIQVRGSAMAPVNSEVADLASLMELKV